MKAVSLKVLGIAASLCLWFAFPTYLTIVATQQDVSPAPIDISKGGDLQSVALWTGIPIEQLEAVQRSSETGIRKSSMAFEDMLPFKIPAWPIHLLLTYTVYGLPGFVFWFMLIFAWPHIKASYPPLWREEPT